MGNTLSFIGNLTVLYNQVGKCAAAAGEMKLDPSLVASLEAHRETLRKALNALIDNAFEDLTDGSLPIMAELQSAKDNVGKAVQAVNDRTAFAGQVVEAVGLIDQVVAQVRNLCRIG